MTVQISSSIGAAGMALQHIFFDFLATISATAQCSILTYLKTLMIENFIFFRKQMC